MALAWDELSPGLGSLGLYLLPLTPHPWVIPKASALLGLLAPCIPERWCSYLGR
jgi:hypothetical protein